MIDRLEEIKSFKKNKNRKALNEGLKLWKRKVEIPDPISLYKQILTPEILSHFRSTVSQNVIYDLKQNHNREIDYFDLPPLLYIYYSLYSDPKSYSHIVIDEAQDLSYAHFAVLKKITKTMTILGDVEQSIFIDYGQSNWEGVQELIFNSNKDMQLNMSTSYRSTKEIIESANKVLTNQFPKHESITALNRSGPNVDINKINDGEDLLKNITTTLTKWKKKYNRVAIIHKDEAKAMRLTEYLKTEYQDEVSYINTDTTTNTGFISVLASYNSKGMEFDAVILANVNEATFPKDDFHARLLYVLLTRAQEEVQVFYQDTPSLLLKGLVEKEPIHASLFDDIL